MVDIARTTLRTCRAAQTGRLAVVPPRDDGYIWIATQNGLLRFDGVSGKQARISSPTTWMYKATTNSAGRLFDVSPERFTMLAFPNSPFRFFAS